MKQEPRIQRILVGVDEMTAADHAVRAGAMLAEAFDARLQLIHAARLDVPKWMSKVAGPLPSLTDRLLEAARRSRMEHLNEILPGTWTSSLGDMLTVVRDTPATAILRHAETDQSDLILLGGHRRRSVLHMGATARNVLGKTACPVWVQAEPLGKVERILAAVDMSPHCEVTLRMARLLASKLDATVLVFHSFVPPYFSYDDPPVEVGAGPTYGWEDFKTAERQHFENVVKRFDWGGVTVETTFSDGDPAQRILDLQSAIDLTVMGTHGRTGLARAILGSQAYAVIREAAKPVLAIPVPESHAS